MKTLTSLLLVSVLGFAAGCGKADKAAASAQAPATKLTYKMHWIPDAHQLGFWIAVDKGIYRQHGLEVEAYPGGMDANPIRDVVNGSADIGQVGGVEQVVLAAGEGLPIKAIASLHRRSPHALISLAERPIEKAADLRGKTVAVAFGDTAEILLKAYLDAEKIPADSVKLVPFRFDLTPLLSGQVDAVTGFSTGQPVTLRENKREPRILSYDAAGIKSYGYTLVASDKVIASKPEALRAFIAASREGWKYAFAHPDEAAALFKQRFGESVDVERTKAELNLIRSIMLDGQGELARWDLDAKTVEDVKDILAKYSTAKQTLGTSAIFVNSFNQ
jgi:NitT/TauT family transport system substrate-binding protein